MNRIYKVIYSKARQCSIVVSEFAKSSHKNSRKGAGHTGTPALARIIATALAAGALTWGIAPGVSWAAPGNDQSAVVFDDKGSLKSTDANISHQILQFPGSFPEGEGQSIALGKGAHAFMQGGSKAENMLFGMKKAAGAIAIGEGSQALSQSIAIGNRTYTGDIGDVNISNYKNFYGDGGAGSGVGSVLLGTNSYTGGTLSTLIGDYSIMSTSYPNGNSAAYTQNAGAVSIGAFNSIESATSTNTTSGIANSIVGLANRTQNANGALIYGAGNEITNSIATASAPGYGSSAKAAANDLRQSVKSNPGGAALAIGGGNKIDKSIRTQTMGVNNEVTGSLYHEDAKYGEFWGHKYLSSPEVNEYSSQYNMVDGYNNKVSNTNNAYVIGTNNTILGKTFSADTKDGTLSKADRTKATVYNEVRPSKDGKYVKMSQTTGENLLNLDSQVQTNTDKLSDVDSRSVKYDTKTVNDKTVVDNTKITLAGEGGTTITNLKDGVNANDAATMGQLNDRISGVTYKAGDGIKYGTDADNNKTISVNKGDGLKFTEDHKLAVNTGKHLSVNTNGQIDVGDNGTVAENDGNLVTGDTVYKALNGGMTKMIIGTPGKDGKDGKDGTPGTIGLVGPAGTNGKDGAVDITIQKGEDGKDGTKGANGVDGKNGINRIVYEDKNGKHQVATMEDGLKFAGDDGQNDATKAIAKKLNNTVDIIGGADSKKLTANNIGVNNVGGKLKVQLAQDLTGITSISGSTDDKGAKITLDTTDKNISVNGGSIKDVASNLTKDGKIIIGSDNNAASIRDVQTLVQQGVDNGYTHGDGITIQKDGTSGKNVISVNQGDGLKFDSGKLAVDTGDGLTVDETTKALKIKTSDSNLKVDSNGIGLSDKITIGSDKTKQVTIDGTKGEISGLTNTTWDSKANDYSKSTKAATESQVDAAVKDAVKQAGDNDVDTHVKAGSYEVDANHQVSMDIVDKNGKATGKKVTITDVATHTEVGDVAKLDKGVQNASGTTSVVDAINNVNTSMNTKIGDQKYSTSGTNKYVSDGDSITSAIGKLDGAVQQAASAAGKHSTVSEGSNIKVNGNVQNDGHMDYKVSLKDDISLNSVTTDTLTVNNSATIGGVTIANKTISGLDDTKIEKGSTNAVNAGTIWNELRPSSGTYINQNNTTAQNITNLDTQVKKNSDLVNSDGSTIKIGSKDSATKVDISDKNGSGRVVTGVVTDAADPTSAANVGYVNGVTAANTQQIYRDMNNAYGRLNNNINKAAAGSNALAALHPLDYDPDDRADFAVGYGHYRNANAAAVGAFYHPNENTMVNVGVSLGNGDPGFNAGVSFKVGRGGAGREAMSKTEMAKVINSQSKEIDALKKDNADKDKRIDALEQKMAEILAKLDKNGK